MIKRKKEKVIILSVLGIAAISLGTVGLSTWITGIVSKEASNNITVEVDTVKNNTCVLEAETSDTTLKIGEVLNKSENNLVYTDKNENEVDLSISFSKLKVITSASYTVTSINFALELSDQTGKDSDKQATIIDNKGIGTEQKSYIEMPKELPVLKSSDGTGKLKEYKVWTLGDSESLIYTFGWGSAFGSEGKSPATYYNEELAKVTSIEDKLAIMHTAETTINDMHNRLNGQTIKLKISVTTAEANA